MRIEKTELEFDEIYKGRVKPIATGGHIPFFKKFIGRIVHVILPIHRKAFWLFKESDFALLKKASQESKFNDPYSKQKKEGLLDPLNRISKNLNEFDLQDLIDVVHGFDISKVDKQTKKLITNIKRAYSI